jgi:CheY-like chemotaxis protein
MGIRSTQTCSALVVDDNEDNRILFREALEAVDYRVTEAHNGRLGIDILQGQTFHVLILDMDMPGVNGVQVLHELRKHPEHERMAVVVVTANPHMITAEVESLADHTMGKPINFREFVQFVDRLRSTFASDANG